MKLQWQVTGLLVVEYVGICGEARQNEIGLNLVDCALVDFASGSFKHNKEEDQSALAPARNRFTDLVEFVMCKSFLGKALFCLTYIEWLPSLGSTKRENVATLSVCMVGMLRPELLAAFLIGKLFSLHFFFEFDLQRTNN